MTKADRRWLPYAHPKFIAVMVLVGLPVLGLSIAAMNYVVDRYELMIVVQENTCIPGRIFVVDTQDKKPERGSVFAFTAQGIQSHILKADPQIHVLADVYADGKPILKVMDALPGDKVSVEYQRIAVNDTPIFDQRLALPLTKTLKRKSDDFIRTLTIPDNEYWMMGRLFSSFDARYWGTIKKQQLLGKAHVIF